MKGNRIALSLEALHTSGRKGVAWLIDPDEVDSVETFTLQLQEAVALKVDYFFLGGSLMIQNRIDQIIILIKSHSTIPVILFPGNVIQFSPLADGILFLSLISGRNPELLIGQHVTVAPLLAKADLEVLPTGYMLVDGGVTTSVNYISQTIPLPNHKPELSVATALAGRFLGLQYFYLDAGSGAEIPVSPEIIQAVKKYISAPLIVGGGLNTLEKVKAALNAGADLVVLGNAANKGSGLLKQTCLYLDSQSILVN
jgi:phosphoglycerol geranylgeranyltransferase